MPIWHIIARYPNGQFRNAAHITADSAYEALTHIMHTRTWARGYTDHEAGVAWPFNPDMTINGQPAVEVVAQWYADLAMRRAA